MADVGPETSTLWLSFDEGEIAISADLTAFNRAKRQLDAALDRLRAARANARLSSVRVGPDRDGS